MGNRTVRKWREADFKSKSGQCAKEIIQFLLDNEIWIDTFIYIDGKRIGCYDGEHYKYGNTWDCVFIEDNIYAHNYFEFTGKFLDMSFEGPLYDSLNYYNGCAGEIVVEGFDKILKKYGVYYELGDSWNLATWPIDDATDDSDEKDSLYVIYHCNEWHEYSSFRLIGVISDEKLEDKLSEIQKELDYSDQDMIDYIHVQKVQRNILDI